MYVIRDILKPIAKRYRTCHYAKALGLTPSHTSIILNGYKCSEIAARGIISVCFAIPLGDERIEELLEKYFIETKEE